MKNYFFRLNKDINEELYLNFKIFLEKIEAENLEFAYIIFDTTGGEFEFAVKIIHLISKSKIKFFGIAYGRVHSAGIPIFLSTHTRFGYEKASALVHRAVADKNNPNVSLGDIYEVEEQVFEQISKKLGISIEEVYEMADANTVITMTHPLGKKFFIGN